MNKNWIDDLQCPWCHAPFRSKALGRYQAGGDDILTCACGAYPIVAGIPIIRRGEVGNAGETVEDLVRWIEAGDRHRALQALLIPPEPASPGLAKDWIQALPDLPGFRRFKYQAHAQAWRAARVQAADYIAGLDDPSLFASDFLDYYFRRVGRGREDAYDYFVYRFGQPRHLAVLGFVSLIQRPSAPVLEVGCGCGHLTYSLSLQAHGKTVIGIDHNFFVLYVAKRWVAPEAQYVNCSADVGLPFRSDTFSDVFSSDVFHYLHDKAGCVRELMRVTQPQGQIMLVAMRNRLMPVANAGEPLTPQGYADLFAEWPHRLLVDADMLQRYLQRQGPALAASASPKRLDQAAFLSLVASHDETVFRDYGAFTHWPHGEGSLQINPLYQAEPAQPAGIVHLRRQFPSAFFEADHAEAKTYLPEAVCVDAATWSEIQRGQRSPVVEQLISQCVVLGLPDNFYHTNERIELTSSHEH
ncbi:MAG: methyltransferase domain-containing protein [Anaerolineales bacterium]